MSDNVNEIAAKAATQARRLKVLDITEGRDYIEDPYLALLAEALFYGNKSADRTGVGTRRIFGPQIEFDLRKGFPLLTTKEVHFKSVVHELIWFLSGSTNIKYLQDNGVRIWNEWADSRGNLGPVYGYQWRTFRWEGYMAAGYPPRLRHKEVDQIAEAHRLLREDPDSRRIVVSAWNDSRRIVVSAWNPSQLALQALPPCHCFFQLTTEKFDPNHWNISDSYDRFLNLKVYMRSADVFLGVPFNIASYALLLKMFAASHHMVPAKLVMTFGDLHLYETHVAQATEQLSREPAMEIPAVGIRDAEGKNVWDIRFEDIVLNNYNPHPAIKAKVAV